MSDAKDPYELAATSAAALLASLGIERIDQAYVLGSGWSAAAANLGEPVGEIPLAQLPGFLSPVVAGHGGTARAVRTPAGAVALLFTGRTHYYEGHGVAAVVHAVRTAAAAGATRLVLTNASGGLHPHWAPGTPVLIRDHINLTGVTPLTGPRFVDLTEAWSPALRALAQSIDPTLTEGVYVQFPGPAYETPAEVQMAGILGGDLVGMSTALECIAARETGMEVLGISLVTNPAAGVSGASLNHEEVLDAGRTAEGSLRTLLAGLLEVL
ncbi:MAG: purine-nucleoside phosphorylase [Propioniciclava sp.]